MDRFTPDELAIAVIDPRATCRPCSADDYLGGARTQRAAARGLAQSIASDSSQRPNRTPEEPARSPRIVVLVDDYDIVGAGGTDPLSPLLPFLPVARDLGLHSVSPAGRRRQPGHVRPGRLQVTRVTPAARCC